MMIFLLYWSTRSTTSHDDDFNNRMIMLVNVEVVELLTWCSCTAAE